MCGAILIIGFLLGIIMGIVIASAFGLCKNGNGY